MEINSPIQRSTQKLAFAAVSSSCLVWFYLQIKTVEADPATFSLIISLLLQADKSLFAIPYCTHIVSLVFPDVSVYGIQVSLGHDYPVLIGDYSLLLLLGQVHPPLRQELTILRPGLWSLGITYNGL